LPRLLVWVILSVLFAGCGPPQSSSAAPVTLTVAAAADLQFAFNEIGRRFEQETGHKVVFSFGSTGQLAQQIDNGAPFDLFAAANMSFVEELARKNRLVPETAALYARGRVVLAVNRESGVRAAALTDLLSDTTSYIAIANPSHAPYGAAAKEALVAAGVWEQIEEKIVFGENVRQALQFVQTGDAQVGIVALSVADVPEITWTLVDDALHKPLDQALAVVASSRHQAEARAFAQFVNGAIGRPIMQKYGFTLPGEKAAPPKP